MALPGNRLVGLVGLLLAQISIAASAESGAATPAGETAMCELRIQGDAIRELTLVRQPDGSAATGAMSGQKFRQPGKVLHLPAGRYSLEEVILNSDFQYSPGYGQRQSSFELTPGTPYELVVGAPLVPHVTVKRHGKFLEMDYTIVDGGGRTYDYAPTNGQRLVAPQFRVLKNGQPIGSGSFEYG